MADPNKTIRLLKKLEDLDFCDDAFTTLHHFRGERKVSISGHKNYCRKRDRLKEKNSQVQRRLQLVHDAYTAGGFKSGKRDVFIALAEAAFNEIPPTD